MQINNTDDTQTDDPKKQSYITTSLAKVSIILFLFFF